MSNALLTPTVLTNELLMRFKNNLGFLSTIDHEYDERFSKIGDTLQLRDSARFVANNGADITSQIQDVVETSVPLQISNQKNVAFKFTSKDLTLTIDRFAERYLEGAAVALANKVEVDCLTSAYQKTGNLVGTPGTVPATAAVVLSAGARLDNCSAPVDNNRYLCINPAAQASMVGALSTLFAPSQTIGTQYVKGRMGTALGFDWVMSQNIRTHTNGAQAGTPQYDGTAGLGTGATAATTTIGTKGWTAATTIKAGTVFTIGSVNAVNYVSGDDQGYLKQFSVTADATADGTGKAVLQVSELPTVTGGQKNVTALPVDGASITIASGSASTGYAQNLAYHKSAFTWAMVPLETPHGVHFGKTVVDPKTGLSIRMVSSYNILTDEFITRADVAYGFAARRSQFACRITA